MAEVPPTSASAPETPCTAVRTCSTWSKAAWPATSPGTAWVIRAVSPLTTGRGGLTEASDTGHRTADRVGRGRLGDHHDRARGVDQPVLRQQRLTLDRVE